MPTTATVPVNGQAKQVYTPGKVGTPHAVIANRGTSTVYLGQSGVNAANGFPLLPGMEIVIPNAQVALFAAAGGITTTTPSTTTSAVAAVGATSITVTSNAGFANGQLAVVGSGANQEVVSITGTGAGTVTCSATVYPHNTGETIAQLATSAGSPLYVTGGTT